VNPDPAIQSVLPATQSVLVVDDDEGVALTFSRMLRLHGYRVETATNPQTGLALATAHTPDAIILDLRMPIVGGLEFLRRLRGLKSDRPTAVTIVTGDYFIEEEIAAEIKQLGAQVCFKPMWIDDLVIVVRTMLGSAPPPVGACA
jgi:two-component system response regulator PrrA